MKAHEGGNFVESDMLASLQPGDKAALLVVHFGTTYPETRQRTIEAINRKIADAFPQLTIREAWTSRIVIKRMAARGEKIPVPAQALQQLHAEGFTHVVVQSTNIIEGIEMEALRGEVAQAASLFKDIRVGNPLLYSVDDYRQVLQTVVQHAPARKEVVLVGHGTYTPSTSTYAMMDYMLKAKGYANFHVGTIEGYPSFDDMLQQLKASGKKEVTLMPFMFVAGDHANNDIAVDWKEALVKEGFRVDVMMQGLGELPQIQEQFMEHARFALTHKLIDIKDKKKQYAQSENE
jgi:anaerobic cobaltochelatase (EC 4.99.1.3)